VERHAVVIFIAEKKRQQMLERNTNEVDIKEQRTMSSDLEMQLEQEKENLLREQSSYLFMKAHVRDFEPCFQNAKILNDYVTEHGLAWNQASLEEAFAHTKDQLLPPTDSSAVIASDPAALIVKETTPWPPFSTIEEIKLMDKNIYRQFFFSRKHGAAFQAAVTAVLQGGK
jgi:hypothetical protein